MSHPLFLANAPEHLQALHADLTRLKNRALDARCFDLGADLGTALTEFERGLAAAAQADAHARERQIPPQAIPFVGTIS